MSAGESASFCRRPRSIAVHDGAWRRWCVRSAAVLIWIVAGLLVESIGSYVEYYRIDRPRRDDAQMVEDWWYFLRSSWKTEPIGLHYLRRLLVSFTFELNMAAAGFVMIRGFVVLRFAVSSAV